MQYQNNIKSLPEILQEKIDGVLRLFSDNGVIAAYLFGSHVRDETWRKSDLDFPVLFDQSIEKPDYGQIKIHLLTELIGIFKTNAIDLVCLQEASPYLAYEEIIRSGKIIFSKDEDQRLDFELKAFQRYIDTEPLRKIQKQYFSERMKERKRIIKRTEGITW